jgi:uncharacterized protein YdeI (YjbR/CyaY-like superfamily)
MKTKPDALATLAFESSQEFRGWLARNHTKSPGIWLQLFKKDSGTTTVSYAEALDQALCFGWIDGQKKPGDRASWLQKFTPRRPRSGWSQKNTEHAERLIESGAMTSAGLAEIAAAKADGRWKAAYSSSSSAAAPADFLKALAKHKKASAFFKTLSKANRYSIVYRLQTAKTPETRQKRMETILQMLERGETFH